MNLVEGPNTNQAPHIWKLRRIQSCLTITKSRAPKPNLCCLQCVNWTSPLSVWKFLPVREMRSVQHSYIFLHFIVGLPWVSVSQKDMLRKHMWWLLQFPWMPVCFTGIVYGKKNEKKWKGFKLSFVCDHPSSVIIFDLSHKCKTPHMSNHGSVIICHCCEEII